MIDKIFFVMPEEGQAFLAASVVVQSYIRILMSRIEGDKTGTYGFHLTIARKPIYTWLDEIFISYCGDVKFLSEYSSYSLTHSDHDFVFVFDYHRAANLAKATQKSLVKAFGIMLGIEPTSELPDMRMVTPSINYGVAILGDPAWHWVTKISEWLENNKPEVSVTTVLQDNDTPTPLQAEMLVGELGYSTYLAAAMGRQVVELYPTSVWKNWLGKWSNPNYRMISATSAESVSPALVWRAMEGVWQSHSRQKLIPSRLEK